MFALTILQGKTSALLNSVQKFIEIQVWLLQTFFIYLHNQLKETRNWFKKWPLNLWWISNKTIVEIGNVSKAATFKSFLHQSYKNTQLSFFVTVLFTYLLIFMRQTLTDNFRGLHKNKNCAFPLSSFNSIIVQMSEKYYSSNTVEYLLLSVTFTAKFEIVFVLTFENPFSKSFHFKANRRSIDSSKLRY